MKSSFQIYIGEPLDGCHPLKYQARWLKQFRGGEIDKDIMEMFAEFHAIAIENKVSFEDLTVFALGAATHETYKE